MKESHLKTKTQVYSKNLEKENKRKEGRERVETEEERDVEELMKLLRRECRRIERGFEIGPD